jgi:hypothetical protein
VTFALGEADVASDDVLFSGDLVFAGSVGRTDFPRGSTAQLLRSLAETVLPLEDDTLILSGHGPDTTVGRERPPTPSSRRPLTHRRADARPRPARRTPPRPSRSRPAARPPHVPSPRRGPTMATIDANPPSGTRDFLPAEVARRERAFATIREVFAATGSTRSTRRRSSGWRSSPASTARRATS